MIFWKFACISVSLFVCVCECAGFLIALHQELIPMDKITQKIASISWTLTQSVYYSLARLN